MKAKCSKGLLNKDLTTLKDILTFFFFFELII